MKGYQKLTIITAILGLVIPFIGLFLYFLINSFVGIPILALFVGWALLIAIAIIAINVGGIIATFKIKNPKIVGAILIACGVMLFALIQWFALPALALFIIAGILAFREKNTLSNLKSDKLAP